MTFKSKLMGLGTPGGQAGAILGGAQSSLTATGSAQTDALLLADTNSQFSTVAAGTGAILPSVMQIGDSARVFNYGANTLSVYPPVGGAIGTGATNAAFSVAAGKSAQFFMLSPTLFGVTLSA